MAKDKGKKEKKEKKSNKKNHTFRNILIFILFLVIGIGIGVYGTKWYLNSKVEDEVEEPNVKTGPEDITNDNQTKELINNLKSILMDDEMFYTTKGVNVATLDNTSKLTYLYKKLISENQGVKETSETYYGNTTCDNGFIVDESDGTLVSFTCTYIKINKDLFKELNKKIFNDELLDTSVEFSPVNGKKCINDAENNYLCGNIVNESGVTGNLESKFTIEKVTRDEDGTIAIYERGYLIDKRSNADDPNDQYDNYYLHSSDSTQHYYELKNADNLTFKHTFKTSDRINYYYVSTEMVEKIEK